MYDDITLVFCDADGFIRSIVNVVTASAPHSNVKGSTGPYCPFVLHCRKSGERGCQRRFEGVTCLYVATHIHCSIWPARARVYVVWGQVQYLYSY